ncbi:MAG: hypothetical protein IJ523_11250 [Succinivibrionaceae bacterium]|nr:hypothetical protein [Succinivibrionaceae bacterium]
MPFQRIKENAEYLYNLSHTYPYPYPPPSPTPTASAAAPTALTSDRKIYSAVPKSFSTSVTPGNVYHRFLSWDHCYDAFGNVFAPTATATATATVTLQLKDYLALHLAYFLASWGMYRGSSFLLQVDYKALIPIVDKILCIDPSSGTFVYQSLFGIDWSTLNAVQKQTNIDLLFDKTNGLVNFISNHFNNIRNYVVFITGSSLTFPPTPVTSNNPVSPILVSKVLLGTLGCVPAYDDFFTQGIRKISPPTTTTIRITRTFGSASINDLISLYSAPTNTPYDFNPPRRNMITPGGRVYPEMKFLDMGIWIY